MGKKIEAVSIDWESLIGKEVETRNNQFGYYVNNAYFRRVSYFLKGIPKEWLGKWAAKIAAEYAAENINRLASRSGPEIIEEVKQAPWRKRDDAADRGTAIHAAIEAYVKDEPLPENLTDEQAECAFHLEQFLRANNIKVKASEMTVFSPRFGYAGTLDLWGWVGDGETILDFKSSAGVYPEYSVQLSAYHHAEFAVCDGKVIQWYVPGLERTMGVVHVDANGVLFHPLLYDPSLFDIFRAAQKIRQWVKDVDDYNGPPDIPVFGSPVALINERKGVAA